MSGDWKSWEGHRLTAYMHWSERLDESGDATAPDARGLWRPRGVPVEENYKRRFLPDEFAAATDAAASSDAIEFPVPVGGASPEIDPETLPETDDIEVIVGIVDTDIPLGHRAFRDAEGRPRALHHWQMQFGSDGTSGQNGRVFTKADLEKLLRTHSGGSLLHALDAQGFNTATGALDMANPRGHHALLGRHAHGAHVLDVAAGADADTDFARKVGIVTVGIPPRWDFGEAGELLDIMMVLAVDHIARVSLELWKKRFAKEGAGRIGRAGYPTVVNLAFGRQAGSKRDDGGWFPVLLRQIKNKANEFGTLQPNPFDVVMPAGNDNLGRVAARYVLEPGGEPVDIAWRLLPADQSDNYVELWADPLKQASRPRSEEAPKLAVTLIPPGGPEIPPSEGPPWHYRDLLGRAGGGGLSPFGARLYRLVEPNKKGEAAARRPGYLLATGPTDPRAKTLMAVPQGLWTIRLRNDGDSPLLVELAVQTDQSVLPVAGLSGRSYLDDPDYRVHDDAGRLLDSVRLLDDGTWEQTDVDTGTLRRGTINAASSHGNVATVGGYRASDGGPASYSATGTGTYGRDKRRNAPTASLPTDSSAVLLGTLAAGASDGARVAMRGTSFAAAQATRIVAEAWLAQSDTHTALKDAERVLIRAAVDYNEKPEHFVPYDPAGKGAAAFAKFGHGRAPDPRSPAIPRRDN